MSTPEEKREAIIHSMKVVKKRIQRFEAMKENGIRLSKSQLTEYDKCMELIRRGEELLNG